jgi:hypothetical protein
METPERSQARRSHGWEKRGGVGSDPIVPNPKLKLLDQVREVMRLKHYSIRTEQESVNENVILGIADDRAWHSFSRAVQEDWVRTQPH